MATYFCQTRCHNGHVLAELDFMSPMAAHFISCREARCYKFHQLWNTEDILPARSVLSYERILLDVGWVRRRCGRKLTGRKSDLKTLPIPKARQNG